MYLNCSLLHLQTEMMGRSFSDNYQLLATISLVIGRVKLSKAV